MLHDLSTTASYLTNQLKAFPFYVNVLWTFSTRWLSKLRSVKNVDWKRDEEVTLTLAIPTETPSPHLCPLPSYVSLEATTHTDTFSQVCFSTVSIPLNVAASQTGLSTFRLFFTHTCLYVCVCVCTTTTSCLVLAYWVGKLIWPCPAAGTVNRCRVKFSLVDSFWSYSNWSAPLATALSHPNRLLRLDKTHWLVSADCYAIADNW